jgi:hypothetical protein
MLGLLAIALIDVSCEKRAQSDSGSNDGKLRPEVAAATKNASPSPGLGDPTITPALSPSSSPR